MQKSHYLIVHREVAPDVFLKVVDAKEMLNQNKVASVTEAVKEVGISRSTYYKYADFVFPLGEGPLGKRTTLNFKLFHQSGVLSKILSMIAVHNGNILTITQDAPVHHVANVSLTFDIANLDISLHALIEDMKALDGVEQLTLINIE